MECNVIFVQLWVEHNLQIDLASEDVFSSLMLNRVQKILLSFAKQDSMRSTLNCFFIRVIKEIP